MKTKQVIKRVAEYDQFGYPRWTSVTTEKRIFDDEDKMAVVTEYQAGKMTAAQIVEKYHLSSRQVLFNWMDRYLREESLSLGASELELGTRLQEVPEPDRRRSPEPSEPDMGRGHHLRRNRRGLPILQPRICGSARPNSRE